jgi:outer membrane protein OmpA-like peptidoglycan-associated protein/osmotically-inducible protein OsmY
MKNLLIWLLGLLMIGVLSFFCFDNKAEIVKERLQQQADNAYAREGMEWVKSHLKGEGFETKRVLVLEGEAPSLSLKERALIVAKGISGIARVENNLKVSQAAVMVTTPLVIEENSSQEEVEEIKEVEKEKRQERDDVVPSPYKFKASKDRSGVVTLEGYVPTQETREAVVEKAGALFGEINVIDSLFVAHGAPDSWQESTILGLEKLNVLEHGVVDLEDSKFLLSGEIERRAQAEVLKENIKNGLDSRYQTQFDIKVVEHDTPQIKEPIQERAKRSKQVAPQACQAALKEAMAKEKIQFNYNKATIKESSYPLLNQIVKIAKACPKEMIEIGGHTDSIGSYDYNKILSQKRADSVKAYMMKQGIKKERLKAIGYGERKPIADNMHKEGRAINRRIEFRIKGGES